MKIAIRAEGGLGDVLLFNRFVPAIKEKYPISEISLYIDSEGKTFQKEVVEYLYPSFYKEIKVIPRKKYKPFFIDSQFGTENQNGFIENVPDDISQEIMTHDVWYDGHIDSLKWIDYEFDWYKYFRHFPTPEVKPINNVGEYIVCNLVSTTHNMPKLYILNLITKLKELNKKIIIISAPEINHNYDFFVSDPQIEIVNKPIKEICNLIHNAKLFIGTDSGFRYVAYGCSVPVITFSKQSQAAHEVQPSHYLRWLIFPELTFPLSFDFNYIFRLAGKILQNKGYSLVPYLQDFNSQTIRRIYKVNLEKSIINNDH
jgi:hypothetical protein